MANPFNRILFKLKERLSKKQFLILLCIMVGITSGLAAILLKSTVFIIHSFISLSNRIYSQNYLLLLFPLLGLLLTLAAIKYILKNKFRKGTSQILTAIAKKSSSIEKETTYSHIITSALTVGLGGSAGLESPIVVTGAAIGSNYGQFSKMDYRERTLLLACGSAAGIAAVFNAPIAGIMFAVEVILVEGSLYAFVPLIISAVSGALCSKIILNEDILLTFTLKQPFNYINIPYYIGLGIIAGLVSISYANIYIKIDHLAKKVNTRLKKILIGGVCLGILVFLFPPVFGEGYDSVVMLAGLRPDNLLENSLFYNFTNNEWFVLIFIGAVCFVKILATALTLNLGGNGGNFAPSLFVGAFLGFTYSRFINMINAGVLPESNFTLVGMAGILSGVLYAPLTGIFLIAEVTSGYELMIPLMIVSSISYGIVRSFEPYSMEMREHARKGDILTENKDRNVLTLLEIRGIIETDFLPVNYDKKIFELKDLIVRSKRNLFPVVDGKGILLGIVYLENIREILYDIPSFNDLNVIELMSVSPAVVDISEDMRSVMRKFDDSKAWNLPVTENGRYIGFVSKSNILTKYREQIISSSNE